MGESSTLAVHRCRFVDYAPSAITSILVPPLPLPSTKGKQKAGVSRRTGHLVVGRANGDIEIYEWTGPQGEVVGVPQAWVVCKTLAGPNPSKVDSLALALRNPWKLGAGEIPGLEDIRIFSAGCGSELLEWDIEHDEVKRTISSNGGSIWSIAVNPASSKLALGCEDGSIQILSIENNALFHQQRLDRSKSRVLSLAWGPVAPPAKKSTQTASEEDDSDEDDEEWIDSWLVAGCSDSSLRKYDLATGRIIERMSTDKVRGERTLVWTVGVLGDGTIISGDSLGMVKFWDSRTCTQVQSLQAHGADVLCMTIGPDGTSIYTSGVDQKTVQFTRVKTGSPGHSISTSSRRWALTASKRMHSHDVRALAVWPPYTPVPPSYQGHAHADLVPILVSGGLDMSLAVTPAALPQTTTRAKLTNPLSTSVTVTFEDANHRRIAYSSGFNGMSGVHLSRKARLLLCLQETTATLWRIPGEPSVEGDKDAESSYEEVLRMDLNVKTNITCGTISGDGKWLAVADQFEVKLFALHASYGNDIKPRRIRDFTSITQVDPSSPMRGASCLLFSPDSSRLIIGDKFAHVLVVELGKDGALPQLLRRFAHHSISDAVIGERVVKGLPHRHPHPDGGEDINMDDGQSNHEKVPPGAVPATITRMTISPDGQWLATADDRRRTHIFNLDVLQHHSLLPSFRRAIRALAFSPVTPSLLILAFSNNTLELYDVDARQAPPWSRRFCHSLPKSFTHLHDPVLGVALPPPSPDRSGVFALFWGATWLCKVDFTAEIGVGGFTKKRRRQDGMHAKTGKGGDNFKMYMQYRQVLLAEFASERELVVVERPLVDVLAKLPPAYFKPKYGAT
ncbi:WD40 repeat-like protein [Vararia minispora EC-137]|uniref:WD40 repeat-like protein n=1 Tax=Vararia minispora EC-137 TaxID=1314806 RepID=A0ACB8QTC2_9AGAM|nr:WD40 repeat-like protein [Vararia minispora EC-137]